jgi:defect in organelle trafficking protein DotC
MISMNRSKGALTISATMMLMLTGCASNSTPASVQATPQPAATVTVKPTPAPAAPVAQAQPAMVIKSDPASHDAQPLYQPTKVEVSDADIGYVKVGEFPNSSSQINPIRWQALYDTALSLGATGALAWRSEQINLSLTQNAGELNQVFDFNQLLLKDNVLPPVLVESDNNLNLASNDAIRLAAKTYKIISPARFVTTAPSWRNYLWMNYPKPPVPDRSLLPKNQAEAQAWNRFIREGWQNGITQANAIFSSNLNRLRRDYNGMVLYRKMLAQDMVSAPFVAKADLGITGDSNEMRIDDRVLRITAHSELQTDSSKWQPILTNPQQDLNP